MSGPSSPLRKRTLGLLAVVGFVALAGCTAGPLGPDPVNQDALERNATYDWNATANTGVNASIHVTGGEYRAVYNVSARGGGTDEGTATFPVYRRDALGRNNPLSIEALEYRYPNGTVVGSEALDVENERKRTVITLPADGGQVAFRASTGGKQFSTQTFVNGGYEVTLPAGMRVGFGPLARVSPGWDQKTMANGHVTLSWNEVRGRSLVVRYYLARDLWIFAAGAVVAILVAVAGAAYYRRQIRELERKRREVGPGVESESDGPS